MTIRAVEFGLDLILDCVRVRAVIASHPLELIADVACNS